MAAETENPLEVAYAALQSRTNDLVRGQEVLGSIHDEVKFRKNRRLGFLPDTVRNVVFSFQRRIGKDSNDGSKPLQRIYEKHAEQQRILKNRVNSQRQYVLSEAGWTPGIHPLVDVTYFSDPQSNSNKGDVKVRFIVPVADTTITAERNPREFTVFLDETLENPVVKVPDSRQEAPSVYIPASIGALLFSERNYWYPEDIALMRVVPVTEESLTVTPQALSRTPAASRT